MMVFGAVTRKNVRVAPATALSASSSDALRRSTVTGASRNAGSKTRLMLANRAIVEEHVAAARVAEHQRRRHLDAGGRSRPGGGRSRVRSISVCSSVLPSRATAILRAQLVARRCAARRRCRRSPGFSSDGELVLDQRLFELAGRGEPAAALKCSCGRAQLRAIEREARVAIVRASGAAPSCTRRRPGRSPGGVRPRGRVERAGSRAAAREQAGHRPATARAEAAGRSSASGRIA